SSSQLRNPRRTLIRYASRLRRTKISPPRTCTSNNSNGRGGGPEMFLPFRSYWPLWQGPQTRCRSSRDWMGKERGGHVGGTGRNFPPRGRQSRTVRCPKRKKFHRDR